MTINNLVLNLQDKVSKNNYVEAVALLKDIPAVDTATVLAELSVNQAWLVLSLIDKVEQALIFKHVNSLFQKKIMQVIPQDELVSLFETLGHDDRADLFNLLEPQARQAVLTKLSQSARDDIKLLSSYPEDSVGSVMTSSYVALQLEQKVVDALAFIRTEALDVETIYQAYILDVSGVLVGAVSLKDLVIANPELSLEEIMIKEVISSKDHASRNDVVQKISRYDLLAVPVVDDAGRMLGIVTYDDAFDVSQEENLDDQMKLGAVGNLAVSIKDASIGMLYRTRFAWLVLLVFGNIFSGAGIAHFEDLIESMIALVFFLPLLVDSGGNAGSQSATLMVRALATGEVVLKDWMRMLGKEISVSFFLGISMALAVSLIGLVRAGPEIAMVVALTMVAIVMVGSVIGMLLPFILARLKFDPATASAPLITSICDGVGVLIYFNVASFLLVMPAVS